MEEKLSSLQDDTKSSKSFTFALETAHKSLLQTIVENNYILAVPPDRQVENFDRIPEQRLVEHVLIKSPFSRDRLMNLNGKHFQLIQNGTKLRRLCRGGPVSADATIISEKVKQSCFGSYHCIYLDTVLDEAHVEMGRKESDSLRMFYSASQRERLQELFEQAIQQHAMATAREKEGISSVNIQQLVTNITHTTLAKAHETLQAAVQDCALIKGQENFFMNYIRKKTRRDWEEAVNCLDQVRSVGQEDLRKALVSNIVECFVHQSIGDYIQKEVSKCYESEQQKLEKQIERYKKRPSELEIPTVYNTCSFEKALAAFEMIEFPLYPFEMLKLLRQANERALIELHEFGVARQLPASTLKHTKIDGDNIQYLLASLLLKSKNPQKQNLRACAIYMREFTYFPNTHDQSAYLVAHLEGAIQLVLEGREDKLQTQLDNHLMMSAPPMSQSVIQQPSSLSSSSIRAEPKIVERPVSMRTYSRDAAPPSMPLSQSVVGNFSASMIVGARPEPTPAPVANRYSGASASKKPVQASSYKKPPATIDSASDEDDLNFE